MTLAVVHVFDQVVARFVAAAAPGPAVPQVFGWRERPKHPKAPNVGTARRIVWVPGDDTSGDLGEVAPARAPGGDPRPLATLQELVTVYLEASDLGSAATAESERAQYIACRDLYDAWHAALYNVARGAFVIVRSSWVITQTERRHGSAIRVLVAIGAVLPDAVRSESITDLLGATWEAEELDHSETGSVERVP